MLCYKLNNLPVHHHHTVMNLYEIILYLMATNFQRAQFSQIDLVKNFTEIIFVDGEKPNEIEDYWLYAS